MHSKINCKKEHKMADRSNRESATREKTGKKN